MKIRMTGLIALSALAFATPALAQETVFVHRLGRDTVAVEQFTRTATDRKSTRLNSSH